MYIHIEHAQHSTSSPLHDAAEEDDVETMIALITIGANVNETDDSGMFESRRETAFSSKAAAEILESIDADAADVKNLNGNAAAQSLVDSYPHFTLSSPGDEPVERVS